MWCHRYLRDGKEKCGVMYLMWLGMERNSRLMQKLSVFKQLIWHRVVLLVFWLLGLFDFLAEILQVEKLFVLMFSICCRHYSFSFLFLLFFMSSVLH